MTSYFIRELIGIDNNNILRWVVTFNYRSIEISVYGHLVCGISRTSEKVVWTIFPLKKVNPLERKIAELVGLFI